MYIYNLSGVIFVKVKYIHAVKKGQSVSNLLQPFFVQTSLFLKTLDDFACFCLTVYNWNDQRRPHKFLASSTKGRKDVLCTSFCKLVSKNVFWNIIILRRKWNNVYCPKCQPLRYFILSSETFRCNIWWLTYVHLT